MSTKVATVYRLRLYTDQRFTHTGTHLRGAVIHRFPDRDLLHNHPRGTYRGSSVRFLVHDGVPHVVGFGDGAPEVMELYSRVPSINAAGVEYRVTGHELFTIPTEVGVVDRLDAWRSRTPWLGLNQANHTRFGQARGHGERREMLTRILIGNLLVTMREMGVELPQDERIMLRVEHWRSRTIRVGANNLLGFLVDFTGNIAWSPWIGLGKMPSKGFGLFERG